MQLKKQLIPGFDPNAGADLEHAAPTAGTAGKPIEIEVRVTRGNVFDLVVATRRRGELAYQHVRRVAARRATLARAVHAEPSAKPYVLEYYVEARDAGGAPIARIAAPDQPLEIALAAGGAEARDSAWYSRWYVIAGGAVVAAGVTGDRRRSDTRPRPGHAPAGIGHAHTEVSGFPTANPRRDRAPHRH